MGIFTKIFINKTFFLRAMVIQPTVECIHADVEALKNDIAVIKHILSEEGKLSLLARRALKEARETPDEEYVPHLELKKRVLI